MRVFVFLSLVCAGCGGAEDTQTAPEPVQIAPSEGGATPVAPSERPRAASDTPRALLERIQEQIAANDMAGVRLSVLDFTVPGKGSMPDQVVAGITGRRERGDWAYSAPALSALIERADEFTRPEPELGALLARRMGGLDHRLSDPSRMLVFEDGDVHVVLVEWQESVYLVFWENLTALVGTSATPAATSP